MALLIAYVTKLIDPEVGTLNGSLQHQAQAFFLSFHPSPSRRGREQSSEVPVELPESPSAE